MPRSPRARPVDTAEAIRLFAEHHIVAIRKARRNGEIVAVKHAAWGWMSPKDFYLLQELHTFFKEAIPKFIEGGYRLKAAIFSWEIDFEVLATGVKLPAGLAIVAGAFALAALDEAEGHPEKAALDILSLGLPFGELWLIYRGVLAAVEIQGSIAGIAGKVGDLVRGFLPPILPPLPV